MAGRGSVERRGLLRRGRLRDGFPQRNQQTLLHLCYVTAVVLRIRIRINCGVRRLVYLQVIGTLSTAKSTISDLIAASMIKKEKRGESNIRLMSSRWKIVAKVLVVSIT